MAEDLDLATASASVGEAAIASTDMEPKARRLRRTRKEVVDGMPPRPAWPWPPKSAFQYQKAEVKGDADKEYDTYLATRQALNWYCDGVAEAQIIADALVPLKQGQLWRLLARALETNPATGQINGYWVCKPNWSPANPDGGSQPKQHLGTLFAEHPDIESRMCAFALGQPVTDLKGDPVPVPAHLSPHPVYRFFLLLCRQKKLSRDGWPYKLDGIELTHAGREAVRRWWKAECYRSPSKAAWVLLSADAASLTKRDFGRLVPQAPYVNTFRLFERSQLDEHKVDAMFTLHRPMLEGMTSPLITSRVWLLGMVECSCDLTLASGMSYGPRYNVRDVLRLLYRSVKPPGRFDLALKHEEFDYLPGAAYPRELQQFAQSGVYELCLDSDSTHLADETLEAIRQALHCKVVNGRVGVPEKNNYIERLFGQLAPDWAILPSATGSWHGSPLRSNPEKKAESLHIQWRHAEHIFDVLMRNRNVEPRPSFGGYSPLQRAQEMLKGGKVVATELGVFSEATLYRFLRRETGKLTHLRGYLSSPFVINCNYGKYTSRELNTEAMRNVLFGADTTVDVYVQEDARFAVAVPRAAPDRAISVALMGPKAATAHTFEMRQLTAQIGKKVHRHFMAQNIDPAWGATLAIARAARKNSPEAQAVAPSVSFMERALHGELQYVDLPAETQERLLKEAAEIAKKEGWTGDEEEEGASASPAPTPTKSRVDAPKHSVPPPSAPATPAPAQDDPFGWLNRER